MLTVKVYSTPTCPFCQRLKAFLAEKQVAYEDFDISADEQAREEIFKKSGQLVVPQIEINGKLIIGFDQTTLEKELGLTG